MLVGCHSWTASEDTQIPVGPGEQRTFELKEIAPEQAKDLLTQLALGTISIVPDRNAIAVIGSASDVYRASVALDLVDTRERYRVETLASVSEAESVPANDHIAEVLGGVQIGTFAHPPQGGDRVRALIDVHGESIVAIIPARIQRELLDSVESTPNRLHPGSGEAGPNAVRSPVAGADGNEVTKGSSSPVFSGSLAPTDAAQNSDTVTPPQAIISTEAIAREPSATETNLPTAGMWEDGRETAGRIVPRAASELTAVKTLYTPALPANAEDVLQLNLPDRLELTQLLDLAAEYLSIDYLYEPDKIRGQSVSLRLHGKLQGEIRVRDLYPLLESVLKFKGLAMTSHQGNLVTIIPVAEALQADPALLDPNDTSLSAGDMVVTRVFNLQYVDTASALNLLDSMKLGVAASPIAGTGTLIVTCYAHRMDRIRRLLEMADRPGRPREFRFRQLKYAMARTLANKVELLASQLQTIPVKIAPLAPKRPAAMQEVHVSSPPPPPTPQGATEAVSGSSGERHTVYLDVDERTNRLLMIGPVEELATVEELINVLDVAQHDPRTIKVYPIAHLPATDAKEKLEELEIVREAPLVAGAAPPLSVKRVRRSPDSPSRATEAEPIEIEQIQVAVLEATNSLLVNAVQEQHARIAAVLRHMDVVQPDLRSFKVYEIKHVDAEEVKKQFSQFDLVGKNDKTPEIPAPEQTVHPGAILPVAPTTMAEEPTTTYEPQVSVLESTNSLLINATVSQHTRMASVIEHVDTPARQEAIPYEIYFLENQDPNQMADVLGRLVQETITDKDGKIQEVASQTEEEIVIIPDGATFSVIVYASRRNQEWVADLIEKLDKRRPQVLIDVTLVEINKTEAFSYDLNLIESFPDLTTTSGLTGSITDTVTASTVLDRLSKSGRSQFADYQSNGGDFTAFYGDKHINLLLQAMQSKNYGRILAKPKILVNDNQAGTIKTTDTTYVTRRSSIPVSSGGAGTDATLIETAVEYESYEAGITLNITPHISQGELLRLDIELTRSDFREMNDEKPPDTTASELTTTVFVPDGSTIILGGLVKLNQNKGGAKVPLLGDIPLVGGLFRSINNSDIQNKLYVFVKAEIIRPGGTQSQSMAELETLSQKNRAAFEKHESGFQNYQDWPGIKPKPIEPKSVLEAQ